MLHACCCKMDVDKRKEPRSQVICAGRLSAAGRWTIVKDDVMENDRASIIWYSCL